MARILMISYMTFVVLLGETVGWLASTQQPAKKTDWSDNFTSCNGGAVISLKWVCDGEDDCGDGSNETAYHSYSVSFRFSNIRVVGRVKLDVSEYTTVTNRNDRWFKPRLYWTRRQFDWKSDPLFMPRSNKEHIRTFNMDYSRREILTSVKWSLEKPLGTNFEPVFAWKPFDANYYLIGITLDQSDRTLCKTVYDAFEIGFKEATFPNESRHNVLFHLPSYHSYGMDSFADRLFWKDIIKSDETEKEVITAAQCKKMGLKILTLHEEMLGDTCYQGSGDQCDHIYLCLLHAEKPEFSRLEESRLKVNKQTYQNNKEEHMAEKPWDPIALLALISMLLLQGIKKVAIYLPGTKVTKVKGQTGGVVVVGDYTTVNNYHYHHQSKW